MTTVNRVGFMRLNIEGGLEFIPDTLVDYITQDDETFIIVLKDGRRMRTTDSELVDQLMANGIKFIAGALFEGEPE